VYARDAGGFDDTPRSEMPALREAEQRAAAAEVGVSDVRFLDGYADGLLEVSQALVRDIVRVIRQVRPHRVLTSSPERWWERLGASHPDHMAAGEATVRAVYPAARNPFAFPELLADEALEAWTVPELWLMADEKSDHAVDITETFSRKVAALKAHVSQTGQRQDLEEMLRTWSAARRAASASRRPAGRGLPGHLHRLTGPGVRAGGGRRPSASARGGWRAGACAAPTRRGSRPSSPR